MKKKVSVIIPAYNAEKYIEECIVSIINQTYKNIEIIVVNDGSEDNTMNIVNALKEKDNRIIIINQKNGGVSIARNNGFNNSTGEYIIFVDADDSLENTMIQTLVFNIEKYNADIAICGFKKIYSSGKQENPKILKVEKVFNKIDALRAFFEGKYFGISLWDKLIKRDLAEKISFEENRKINEDKYYLFNAILNSKKIFLYNEGLYNYIQRDFSVSKKKFGINNLDILYFSKKILDNIDSMYPELNEYAIENYICDNIYVYRNIVRTYKKDDPLFKDLRIIKNNLKKYKRFDKKKKKYNQIEFYLICNMEFIYRLILNFFDITVRKWRR